MRARVNMYGLWIIEIQVAQPDVALCFSYGHSFIRLPASNYIPGWLVKQALSPSSYKLKAEIFVVVMFGFVNRTYYFMVKCIMDFEAWNFKWSHVQEGRSHEKKTCHVCVNQSFSWLTTCFFSWGSLRKTESVIANIVLYYLHVAAIFFVCSEAISICSFMLRNVQVNA